MGVINLRRGFLAGTYGWDSFSKALFLLGILLLPYRYTFYAGILIMLYAVIRTFSKKFDKRNREEIAFQNWMRGIKYNFQGVGTKFNSFKYNLKQKKDYVVVKCPKCSQKLRLPRHKGKIVVTCKKCSTEFKTKT